MIQITNKAYCVCNLQIQQIEKHADDLKKEFQAQHDKSIQEVEQTTEEMLLNITVLDDLYIHATHLADRRADKDVLKEFNEASANLIYKNNSLEYEQQVPLKTPFLNIVNY